MARSLLTWVNACRVIRYYKAKYQRSETDVVSTSILLVVYLIAVDYKIFINEIGFKQIKFPLIESPCIN